jgi:hypothetical protein
VPSARGAGVLKADWLHSQRQRRAAAVVVLLRRQEADPDSGSLWSRTQALLEAVRAAAAPRAAAVVAVVLSDQSPGPAPPLPPAWASAVKGALGGGAAGDDEDDGSMTPEVQIYCMSGPDAFPELYGGGARAGGTTATAAPAAETARDDDDDPLAAPARRQLREEALGPLTELVRLCARRYYARRAAKVSAKLAALSSSSSSSSSAAAARVGEAFIKLGTFSEMQADWAAAVGHYLAAHRALAEAARAITAAAAAAGGGGGRAPSAAATTTTPNPQQPGPHAHAQVARAAEVAHYKALTLLLHQGRATEAREQARAHLAAFCRPPLPRCWPSGARAAHRAWCVRQYEVALGMLTGPLAISAAADSAAMAAAEEETAPAEGGGDGAAEVAAAAADAAQRELSPRYLALAAAECALRRRELALSLASQQQQQSHQLLNLSGGASVRCGPYLGQLVLRTPLAAARDAAAAAPSAAPAPAPPPPPPVCGSPLAVGGLMDRSPPLMSGAASPTLQQQQLYVERPLTEDEYAAWAAGEETRAVAVATGAAAGGAAPLLPSQQQALDAVAAAAARLQQLPPASAAATTPLNPQDAAALASAAAAPRLVARLAAAATASSVATAASAAAAASARRSLVALAYWERSEGWDPALLAALAAWRDAVAAAGAGGTEDLSGEAALCALEAAAVGGSGSEEQARRALAAMNAAKCEYSVQHFDARAAQRALVAGEMAASAAAAAAAVAPSRRPLAASLVEAMLRHRQQDAGWLRVLSVSAGFAATAAPAAAGASPAATAPALLLSSQQQQQPPAFCATFLNHAPIALPLDSIEVTLSDASGAWTARLEPEEDESVSGAPSASLTLPERRWRRFAAPLRARRPGLLRAERLVLRLPGGASVSYLLPSFPPPSAAAAVPLLGQAAPPAVVRAVAAAAGPGPLAPLRLASAGEASSTSYYLPRPGVFAVAAPSSAGGGGGAGAGGGPPRVWLAAAAAAAPAQAGGAVPPVVVRALLGEFLPLDVCVAAPSNAPLPEGAFVELTAARAPLSSAGGAAPAALPLVLLTAAASEHGQQPPPPATQLRSLAPEGGNAARLAVPPLPTGGEYALRVWLRCPPAAAASPPAAAVAASVRVSAVLRWPSSPSSAVPAPPLTVLFAAPFEHDAELRAEPGVHVLVAPAPAQHAAAAATGAAAAPVLAAGQTVFATLRVRMGPGLTATSSSSGNDQEEPPLLELLDATYQPPSSPFVAALLPSPSASLLPPATAPLAFGARAAQALSLIVPLRATAPSDGPAIPLGSIMLRWRRRRRTTADAKEEGAAEAAALADVASILELPRAAAVRASPIATARVVAPAAQPVAPGLPGFPLEVQVFNQQQAPAAAAAATAEDGGSAPVPSPPPLSLLLELQPEVGLQPLGEHLAYTMQVPPGEGRAARWQLRAVASGGTGGVRVSKVPAVRVSVEGGAAAAGGSAAAAVVATQRLGLRVSEV